jgi:hypothetical protein
MAGVDAGVLVTCNGCGTTVLQKSMVPVLVAAVPANRGDVATLEAAVPDGPLGAEAMGYLCLPCARLRIAIPPDGAVPADEAVPAG